MLGSGDFEKTCICRDCDRPFDVFSGFSISNFNLCCRLQGPEKKPFFKTLVFLTYIVCFIPSRILHVLHVLHVPP